MQPVCSARLTRLIGILLLGVLLTPIAAGAMGPHGQGLSVRLDTLTLVNGDPADVYLPQIPQRLAEPPADLFPLLVLLQGGLVDKRHYSIYAHRLAQGGYAVVVPNHERTVRQGEMQITGLITEVQVLTAALDTLAAEDADPRSAYYRVLDLDKVGLLGHSLGGAVGIDAAGGVCDPMACDVSEGFARPEALKAAVFFGTHRIDFTDLVLDRDTSGVAVALLQGRLDSVTSPEKALRTLPTLEQPHAFITIDGVNHYGICNTNNPEGANPEANAPTLDQQTAIATLANWTLEWLRPYLGDPLRVHGNGMSTGSAGEIARQPHHPGGLPGTWPPQQQGVGPWPQRP